MASSSPSRHDHILEENEEQRREQMRPIDSVEEVDFSEEQVTPIREEDVYVEEQPSDKPVASNSSITSKRRKKKKFAGPADEEESKRPKKKKTKFVAEEEADNKEKFAGPANEKVSKRPKKKKTKFVAEEEADNKEKKKTKVVAEEETGNKEKTVTGRLWSDEDEMTLLKELDSFIKFGKNPTTELDRFFEFTMDKFSFQPTPYQLLNKIRGCKKKFNKTLRKYNNPNLKNPHRHLVFQLSKMIWAKSESTSESKTECINFTFLNMLLSSSNEFTKMSPFMGNLMSKENLSRLDSSKLMDFETRSKALFDKENDILFERQSLVNEMARAFRDSLQS